MKMGQDRCYGAKLMKFQFYLAESNENKIESNACPSVCNLKGPSCQLSSPGTMWCSGTNAIVCPA